MDYVVVGKVKKRDKDGNMIHVSDIRIPINEFVMDHDYVSYDREDDKQLNTLCRVCDKNKSLHQLDNYLNLYLDENSIIKREKI
jgi:hypothetical protein